MVILVFFVFVDDGGDLVISGGLGVSENLFCDGFVVDVYVKGFN